MHPFHGLRFSMVVQACLLLLLVVLSLPATAQEWRYTARKGDNLWVLAKDFLVSMEHWREFRAMNDVPNPRRMAPGTVIRFPARWLRVAPAPVEIVVVQGAVTARNADGAEAAARAGTTLGPGASITTGANASVVLRFADGGQMLVRPRSEVVMDELGIHGRRRLLVDTRVRMQRGRVEVEVPGGQDSRMEIITPSASALVRGTGFRVASESGLSRTEVEEGRVAVTASAARVDVDAGRGVVVRQGEPPSTPSPLLEAPSLDPVPLLIERRQLRIAWSGVPGAVRYGVQLATPQAQPVLLADLSTDGPRLELPDLPDGRYLLRVRAVDSLGLEGRGAEKVFELNARPEPPASLEPRPEATVRITRPVFRWSEPADVATYRLQVASDAAFAHPVLDQRGIQVTRWEVAHDLAPGGYFWRLASFSASGEQGPYGDPLSFTVRPAPSAPEDAGAEVGETDVLLRWRAGQAGQTYEVEIAAAEDFADGARTESVEAAELRLPVPEHDLWFRVRVVDTDGYRGPWGTPNRIEAPVDTPWWLLGMPLLILLL